MSVHGGPDVAEDGLVLALDAGNPKNYNLTAVEVLVVAGGGGGGGSTAGGGGGGGVIYNPNFAVTPGSALTVTVGAGGQGTVRSDQGAPTNTSGGNSVFGSLTAIGGGRGYSGSNTYTPRTSEVGGSGGGGGYYSGGLNPKGSGTSSAGTSGQGFAGGDGAAISEWGGGGGGGAGGPGGAQVANNSLRTGGPGLGFNISGTFTYYGGGGGGGCYLSGFSLGGIGGGGNGGDGNTYAATAGTPNTGGGGGGGGYYQYGPGGAAGGSGIVIVRYPGPQRAIGGTVTSVGGYTIHTFTTVETTSFTPLAATNDSTILGLADFSGNNRFATTVNSPTYNSSNGGCISFDGSNDYVDLGSDITFKSTGGWTVSSWFNLTQVNSGSLYNFIGASSITYNSWYWTVYQSKLALWNISPGGWYYGSTTILPNTWYQSVLVCNESGTSYQMYLNGVAESGTHTTYSWNSAYAGLIVGYIGRGDAANGRYFYGKYPSILIYNKALTASEIQQNFNANRSKFGI